MNRNEVLFFKCLLGLVSVISQGKFITFFIDIKGFTKKDALSDRISVEPLQNYYESNSLGQAA